MCPSANRLPKHTVQANYYEITSCSQHLPDNDWWTCFWFQGGHVFFHCNELYILTLDTYADIKGILHLTEIQTELSQKK